MSNIDENKVKDLLHILVESMYTMLEDNLYRRTVVDDMHKRINSTNLLTQSEEPDALGIKNLDDDCWGSPTGHVWVKNFHEFYDPKNYLICDYCGTVSE